MTDALRRGPGAGAGLSVNHLTRLWPCPLQLLDRPQNPLPRRKPVQVASLKHGIRPHGGMDRRVIAVVLHEEVGRAVDVEVGDKAQG